MQGRGRGVWGADKVKQSMEEGEGAAWRGRIKGFAV